MGAAAPFVLAVQPVQHPVLAHLAEFVVVGPRLPLARTIGRLAGNRIDRLGLARRLGALLGFRPILAIIGGAGSAGGFHGVLVQPASRGPSTGFFGQQPGVISRQDSAARILRTCTDSLHLLLELIGFLFARVELLLA